MKRIELLKETEEGNTSAGLIKKDLNYLNKEIKSLTRKKEDTEEDLITVLSDPGYALAADALSLFSIIEDCENKINILNKFKKLYYEVS